MRRTIGAVAVVLFAALGALPALADTDPLEIPPLYSFDEAAGMDYFGGLPEPPQTRYTSSKGGKPIFDFNASLLNFSAGIVHFGGDFDAGVDFVGSVSLRVPMPALPTERFGSFVQVFGGHIDRDLESYYENQDGMFYGFAVGADFAFIRHTDWMLLGQLGAVYVTYGDVKGVDDGWGMIVGLQGGMRMGWHRQSNMWLTYTPQFLFDGGDWFVLQTVGLSVGF